MAKTCEERARGDEGRSSKKNEEEDKLWKRIWNLDIKKKNQHKESMSQQTSSGN